MCFGPQLRALFRHLNFQKWSEHPNMLLVPVCLRDVLRTTMACTSSTSQPPKVVAILTSKCALQDNDVHFFDISSSKSRMCGVFSILTSKCGSAPAALASLVFDPPEPQNIGKTQWFWDFSTFSHTWIFFLLSFSSLIFFLLLFSSLALPTSAFPSVHIVGSLTSKLSSITCNMLRNVAGSCYVYRSTEDMIVCIHCIFCACPFHAVTQLKSRK